MVDISFKTRKLRKPYRHYNRNHLRYYQEHPELHHLNRFELSKEAPGLYRALLKSDQLDRVLPPKRRNYRGYSGYLEYYFAHPELHGLRRSDLRDADSGLYTSLLKSGVSSDFIS